MNAIDDDPRRDDDYCTELCCRNHKRPRQHISAFTTYASIVLGMYSFAFYGHLIGNGRSFKQGLAKLVRSLMQEIDFKTSNFLRYPLRLFLYRYRHLRSVCSASSDIPDANADSVRCIGRVIFEMPFSFLG